MEKAHGARAVGWAVPIEVLCNLIVKALDYSVSSCFLFCQRFVA